MGIYGIGSLQNDYDGSWERAGKDKKKGVSGEGMKAGSVIPKATGAPYSYLANEHGVIEYNGVTFTLDHQRKWLCLGEIDPYDLKDVIRVPLSEGGCLMINRENVGELQHAISMFSPEDVNRILRALKLDAKIQQMKREAEDMEDGVGKSSQEEIAAYKQEILEKIRRGETEASFALGGSEFTQKQWNKLMRSVDKAIDDIKESIEEEKEKIEEKEEEKRIRKRFDKKEEMEITMEMLMELLDKNAEEAI